MPVSSAILQCFCYLNYAAVRPSSPLGRCRKLAHEFVSLLLNMWHSLRRLTGEIYSPDITIEVWLAHAIMYSVYSTGSTSAGPELLECASLERSDVLCH